MLSNPAPGALCSPSATYARVEKRRCSVPRSAASRVPLRLRRAATLLALALTPSLCLARNPPPTLRIPLEPLDFQSFPEQVLSSGASILTLHYVDSKHLLVTFNRRRLMARIPGDPETDVDRNIDAVLLELTSGKILARTSWRLHDPGQYLWSLGNGAFLLRQRDVLTLLQPLAGLVVGNAFAEQPFIKSNRPIGSVLLSPEGDLLTLETLDRSPYLPRTRKPSPGTSAYAAAAASAAAAGDAAAEEPEGLVQIDFFRLHREPRAESQERLALAKAGTVAARNMVLLPIDADGFLSVLDEGGAHWAFNFNSHQGKVDELSPFDSSCHPIPFLVSRSEFVAFGCRGGKDPRELGGFNLRGEEMWEQTFTDSFTAPSFSFAPTAGRFALSRLTTSYPVDPQQEVTAGFTAQTVTVYQTESGRQVFSLNCNPILRASENFALSPNGEELAVLNNGAIEIYALPPLSGKDRAGVHLAETLAPEHTNAPILLEGKRDRPGPRVRLEPATPAVASKSPPSEIVPTTTAPSQTPAGEPDAVPVAQKAPLAQQTQLGDAPAEGEGHRKPPTLYAPGEAHDSPTPDATPR